MDLMLLVYYIFFCISYLFMCVITRISKVCLLNQKNKYHLMLLKSMEGLRDNAFKNDYFFWYVRPFSFKQSYYNVRTNYFQDNYGYFFKTKKYFNLLKINTINVDIVKYLILSKLFTGYYFDNIVGTKIKVDKSGLDKLFKNNISINFNANENYYLYQDIFLKYICSIHNAFHSKFFLHRYDYYYTFILKFIDIDNSEKFDQLGRIVLVDNRVNVDFNKVKYSFSNYLSYALDKNFFKDIESDNSKLLTTALYLVYSNSNQKSTNTTLKNATIFSVLSFFKSKGLNKYKKNYSGFFTEIANSKSILLNHNNASVVTQKFNNFFNKSSNFYINFSGSSVTKNIDTDSLNSFNMYFLRKAKIFNKGRYSRNRQTYRTGTYWCIYLSLIVFTGMYYWFYHFVLNLGYLWWLVFGLVASFIFPKVIKFRLYNIKNLYNEFYSSLNWFSHFWYLFVNSLNIFIVTKLSNFSKGLHIRRSYLSILDFDTYFYKYINVTEGADDNWAFIEKQNNFNNFYDFVNSVGFTIHHCKDNQINYKFLNDSNKSANHTVYFEYVHFFDYANINNDNKLIFNNNCVYGGSYYNLTPKFFNTNNTLINSNKESTLLNYVNNRDLYSYPNNIFNSITLTNEKINAVIGVNKLSNDNYNNQVSLVNFTNIIKNIFSYFGSLFSFNNSLDNKTPGDLYSESNKFINNLVNITLLLVSLSAVVFTTTYFLIFFFYNYGFVLNSTLTPDINSFVILLLSILCNEGWFIFKSFIELNSLEKNLGVSIDKTRLYCKYNYNSYDYNKCSVGGFDSLNSSYQDNQFFSKTQTNNTPITPLITEYYDSINFFLQDAKNNDNVDYKFSNLSGNNTSYYNSIDTLYDVPITSNLFNDISNVKTNYIPNHLELTSPIKLHDAAKAKIVNASNLNYEFRLNKFYVNNKFDSFIGNDWIYFNALPNVYKLLTYKYKVFFDWITLDNVTSNNKIIFKKIKEISDSGNISSVKCKKEYLSNNL